MNHHEWSDAYEAAIANFQRHIRRAENGTFKLDVESGSEMGIGDPVIFADLVRSLNFTNELIRRGDLRADDVTPFEGVRLRASN